LLGNAYADSLDVGGAAIDAAFTRPLTVKFDEVESQNGFDIACSFDTANSPAAGDMYVWSSTASVTDFNRGGSLYARLPVLQKETYAPREH